MSRRIEFSARPVGGRIQGRTFIGRPVHPGSMVLEPDSMVWRPGALARAFFVRNPITIDPVVHIQVIEGFWGAVTFFPNDGTDLVFGFKARGSVLSAALDATGYELSTHANWPGRSVAVPKGRRAVWTPEGPNSEPDL